MNRDAEDRTAQPCGYGGESSSVAAALRDAEERTTFGVAAALRDAGDRVAGS